MCIFLVFGLNLKITKIEKQWQKVINSGREYFDY